MRCLRTGLVLAIGSALLLSGHGAAEAKEYKAPLKFLPSDQWTVPGYGKAKPTGKVHSGREFSCLAKEGLPKAKTSVWSLKAAAAKKGGGNFVSYQHITETRDTVKTQSVAKTFTDTDFIKRCLNADQKSLGSSSSSNRILGTVVANSKNNQKASLIASGYLDANRTLIGLEGKGPVVVWTALAATSLGLSITQLMVPGELDKSLADKKMRAAFDAIAKSAAVNIAPPAAIAFLPLTLWKVPGYSEAVRTTDTTAGRQKFCMALEGLPKDKSFVSVVEGAATKGKAHYVGYQHLNTATDPDPLEKEFENITFLKKCFEKDKAVFKASKVKPQWYGRQKVTADNAQTIFTMVLEYADADRRVVGLSGKGPLLVYVALALSQRGFSMVHLVAPGRITKATKNSAERLAFVEIAQRSALAIR